ncbi:aminoglycoside 6'-N-acetyltransferase [Larkinella rosea]|uniref:Aminoglycoside N(6')-acetyltransferase type 1 n=1 Tax=Larkinella rosea TaxID=2025312 RepID=A0A3P1C3F6_9BACT|nr:aminoglycoside 6'-N-acetyltransferase [Larkinella rosea]RRB07603.1 GNAT family N-acetyltransferase [Larkinella rosea]
MATNQNFELTIVPLSTASISPFTELVLELWPDCNFEEEYENSQTILDSATDICYLAQVNDAYVAFIHLTIRHDYVEGAADSPVAYLEALYVKPAYQNHGIGTKLVQLGEEWGRQKGCRQFASDTELTNSASIDFHLKTGFEEVNRIVCFIKNL